MTNRTGVNCVSLVVVVIGYDQKLIIFLVFVSFKVTIGMTLLSGDPCFKT